MNFEQLIFAWEGLHLLLSLLASSMYVLKHNDLFFITFCYFVDVVAENDETLFNSQQVNVSSKAAKNTKVNCPEGTVLLL